jgi:CRISPR-associated endonuclease/helicase Cas3
MTTTGTGDTPPPSLQRFSGASFMRLAGLASFADWIGSSLPFAPMGEDLNEYYAAALDRTSAVLDAIGWRPRESLMREPVPLDDLFAYLSTPESPFRARNLQVCVAELVEDATGPTLLLLEAPTGEGKTEAAFYAHTRLQAAVGHRGMYVALPTQATGNMMFTRTLSFLEQAGSGRELDLQLLHGAASLNDRFQSIVVREDVPDDAHESVCAGEWFTHKKRALLSEYGVGTVDQALMSVLNVKHQFVRLWGLANRTVVIDEVHAYDTYTSGLVTSLIRWLYALGSSVVVMSATLPAAKRRELLAAFGATDVPDAPYPRITRVAHDHCETRSFRPRSQPAIALRPASAAVADVGRLLVELAERGGCVACIVNTVQRAQDLYRFLAATGVPMWLFHARYPANERQRLEQEVTRRFGRDPSFRPKRGVLIGTQVVEQSLDLDFDVMVTDIAPVDLLLQRAGRLHRHDRPREARRGHAEPVLYIAGMTHSGLLPELGAPFYFDSIYERYVLLRTWAALRDKSCIVPPEDVDRLVQLVYGDECIEGQLSDDVRQAFAEAKAAMEKEIRGDQADACAVVIGDPMDRTWESVRPLKRQEDDDLGPFLPVFTRKGSESVSAVPLYVTHDGYVLNREGAEPICLDAVPSPAKAKAISMRTVRLSRRDVVCGLKSDRTPCAGWRNSPLLRDCYPLVLDGVRNVFGRTRVDYTPELGIVYDRAGD